MLDPSALLDSASRIVSFLNCFWLYHLVLDLMQLNAHSEEKGITLRSKPFESIIVTLGRWLAKMAYNVKRYEL